jgi:hypothetical protein
MSATLDERLAEVEAALSVVENLVARLLPETRPADEDYGEDVVRWVEEWFLPRLERQLSTGGGAGVCWCAHWDDHPEAATRLEALRDAWVEATVGTASSMASWWIEKVDPTLRTILAPDGPFARCREQHRRLPELESRAGNGKVAQ